MQVAEDWKKKLPDVVKAFSPENWFNAGETGPFYRLLAKKCVVQKVTLAKVASWQRKS